MQHHRPATSRACQVIRSFVLYRIISMVPSKQNRSCLLSAPRVFLLLLLHTFHTKGVGGANFTIENECSETIWAVVEDATSGGGGFSNCVVNGSVTCNSGQSQTTTTTRYRFQIGPSRSAAFHKESGWNGRVWGRTGCNSNANTCGTSDAADATRAEFGLGPSKFDRRDYYDVSLVDGYNLGMVVEPSGGSGPCRSAGCAEDLNESCPPELSTGGGAACRGPCAVFGTQEYCCTEEQQPCGPTNYSLLFKKLCPRTSTYPKDDTAATTLFSCTAAHYSVIFCPPSASLLEEISPASAQSFDDNPQERRAPSPSHSNNRQRKRERNRATEIITIVSVSIGCVIIVTIAVCIFLKRRQSSQNRKSNQDMENLLLQHGDLAPKRYRYSQIKKMTKSLSDKLGQGGFGCVYKGTLPDGRLVAVKILNEILDSNGEEFVNEVASISRTSHVNIVTLLGFCYEGNKRALVYEYMPNKSLDKFLGDNRDNFLDLNKLFEIAVGIARGLEYLHRGCTTRIVHFDIKPQNILLDEEFCPKISDFGLAKLCKKKQSVLSVQGMRGTTGYIAPEVFLGNYGGVSHKSDVYSYGMMLLVMAGAKKDGGTVVTQSSENYFPDKVYEQVVIDVTSNLDDESMMIEEEEEKRRKMMLIGFWCIQTIPSERPSISKVVEMLEGTLHSIQIPPKPFLFSTVIPNQETSSSSFSSNVET